MVYKAAAREISKGNILPVYLCYGTEQFRMQEFINYATDRIIAPEQKDFAISRFDLSDTPLETILEDAQTLPFLSPKKLLIVSGAYMFTASKDNSKLEHRPELLQQYLQSPAEHAVIIFTVHAEKLDERKKIVKMMKEMGGVILFSELKQEELLDWIQRRVEKSHCTITTNGAEQLLLNAGTSLQAISSEIEKLSLYVGAGGRITRETVDELVMRSLEQTVFVLVEEVVQLRIERAFSMLYELLKQKEEPIKILSLLARQFRMILQVSILSAQGHNGQQMASQLGIHPYAVKLAAEQGRKFDQKRLGTILSQLADLDYQMKSGGIEKVMGLEMFLLKLAV